MGMDRLGKWVLGGRTVSPDHLRGCAVVRNEAVIEMPTESGLVLSVPLASQGSGMLGVLAKWVKSPSERKFELEEVGTFVWSCCDGKQTFETIAKKLRERFRMNRMESEVALADFLRTLGRRNLIMLVEAKGSKKR